MVLVSPRNPLNIGAAARAMSNFGCFDLRLVSPYEASWQEARSGVGARGVLEAARVFASLEQAIADASLVVGTASISRREPHHPVRRLETGARLIRRRLAAGARVALLFGSEKHGLSNRSLSFCHWLVRIPTRLGHESMNLGQAVAVCLWELARCPAAARSLPPEAEAAPAATLGRLEELFDLILAASGYYPAEGGGSGRMKLRRLLHRLELSGPDAEIWLGMLRQIRWKLGSPGRRDAGPGDRS